MEEATIAVPLVGAALGGDGDLATRRFAEFCLIVRREDFYLFNRIRIDGDMGSAVVTCINVRSAVNRELVFVSSSTVDIHGIQTASTRGVTVKTADHSRDEFHVIEDVAAVDGHIVELLISDQIRAFARVRLQLKLSRIRGYVNRFCHGPNLQDKIAGIQLVGGVQNDGLRLQLLEPLSFDRYVIGSRR